MEFVERDEQAKKDEEMLNHARNDGERLLDYAPDELLSSTERLWEAHEARAYKYAADAAMNAMTIRDTENFDETLERYMRNNRRLKAIRDGDAKPETKVEIDPGKVAYTAITQLANLTLAIVCISLGMWPAALISTPALLGLNYYWLVKDQVDGR